LNKTAFGLSERLRFARRALFLDLEMSTQTLRDKLKAEEMGI